MLIIPAIDIKGGKVVRLTQGMADKETIYSDKPLEVAKRWASFGVELIHIVDLDGALEESLKNFDIVKEIAKNIKPKIELGGGIRDIGTIEEVLRAGIEKACIGTKALDQRFLARIAKSNFKNRVVISIDAKDGIVYTKGWVNKTRMPATDLAKETAGFGIKTINYTDISRDGMLEGPNLKSLKEIIKLTKLFKVSIIAAGGVSSMDDVKKLKALESAGLDGMIIGKALYEKRIDLGEAIKICSQKE